MPADGQPDRPPQLFESTAEYYARYRLPYLPAVFDQLGDRFKLGISTPVLDLGCGTGELSIPLAARGIPVYAVDPEVEMLTQGIRREREAEMSGIAWQRGNDLSLTGLHLPQLRLCVMGASFHWTNRDILLRTLDDLLDDLGGVALVTSRPSSVWSDDDDLPLWAPIARETVIEFLGPQRRAGGGTYEHPEELHETVLARSAFSTIEQHRFERQDTLTIDQIVGLQLSTSYASPAQLGTRLGEFNNTLAERLRELEPSGAFDTRVISDLTVAVR